MIRRLLALLVTLAFLTACKSDNASPMTHGAHNKPSDVTSGKTKSDAPPPNTTNPADTVGGEAQYGASTATAGGAKPMTDTGASAGTGGTAQ